jgi:hypothetical protein
MSSSERKLFVARVGSYLTFAAALIGLTTALFGFAMLYPLLEAFGWTIHGAARNASGSQLGFVGGVAIMIALGALALVSLWRPRFGATGIIIVALLGLAFGGILSRSVSAAALVGAILVFLGNRERTRVGSM